MRHQLVSRGMGCGGKATCTDTVKLGTINQKRCSYFVCMIIVSFRNQFSQVDDLEHNTLLPTPNKMLFQRPHETDVSASFLDKPRYVVHDVKRITPHITLSPTSILPGPRPISLPCFHESCFRIEYRERTRHGAVAEELGVG